VQKVENYTFMVFTVNSKGKPAVELFNKESIYEIQWVKKLITRMKLAQKKLQEEEIITIGYVIENLLLSWILKVNNLNVRQYVQELYSLFKVELNEFPFPNIYLSLLNSLL